MRIVNTSSRPITLQQGGVKIDLPVGGFSNVDDSTWEMMKKNKIIESMVSAELVMAAQGPVNREIPLVEKTSEKQMPENLKPKEEVAAFGKSEPIAPKVEQVEVKATGNWKATGKNVSPQKVE